MQTPHHPSNIDPKIVEKVVRRRGRLHAFPTLDPAKTALVVVDLDTETVKREEDDIRSFVPKINELARALRAAGGVVAWVTAHMGHASKNFRALYGDTLADMYEAEIREKPLAVWHELEVLPDDVRAQKQGASAFFPGKCDLHEQLQARGVRSVLIVGAVTNVCCESSGRDAAELEYEVTMVSDCLSGHSNGQPAVTLATFYRNFGDVRPSAEVLELIKAT